MPGTAGHSFHSFTVRFYIYQPISHIKRNERDLISLAFYVYAGARTALTQTFDRTLPEKNRTLLS